MTVRHYLVSDMEEINVPDFMRDIWIKHCDDWKRSYESPVEDNGMCQFIEALREAFPTCKFGYPKDFNNSRKNKLWIYLPNDYYAMGWFSWGNYRDVEGQQKDFVVYSRKIENNKYTYGSDNYYMKFSSKLSVGVANAKAFFRPFTHIEVADSSLYSFCSKSGAFVGKSENRLSEAESLLRQHDKLINELLALRKLSVLRDGQPAAFQLLNADLDSALAAYEHELSEAEHLVLNFDAVCIRVTEHNGQQVFHCVKVTNAHSFMRSQVTKDCTTYTEDDVPPHYIAQISMLMSCEPNDFIMGVGMKVDESIYYVIPQV